MGNVGGLKKKPGVLENLRAIDAASAGGCICRRGHFHGKIFFGALLGGQIRPELDKEGQRIKVKVISWFFQREKPKTGAIGEGAIGWNGNSLHEVR